MQVHALPYSFIKFMLIKMSAIYINILVMLPIGFYGNKSSILSSQKLN